jgi:hypothetical protein
MRTFAMASPKPTKKPGASRLLFPLTERELRKSFGEETWRRAQEYVGAFYATEAGPREIRGSVTGHGDTYSTFLRRVGGYLECACSCPAADDMNCKHAAALGLTYLRGPASFKAMAGKNRTEIRAMGDVSKFLKGTTLDDLVKQLQDRGVTQKQVIEILGINQGLFGSAKRLEKRGRRYGFLNACKLACAYLLGVIEKQGRPD